MKIFEIYENSSGEITDEGNPVQNAALKVANAIRAAAQITDYAEREIKILK